MRGKILSSPAARPSLTLDAMILRIARQVGALLVRRGGITRALRVVNEELARRRRELTSAGPTRRRSACLARRREHTDRRLPS